MTDGPRIPPLAPEDRDERTAALVESLRFGDEDMNLFATLAHHPRLLRRWSQFGGLLLFGGTLPGRDREVLILRTAFNTGADYEWGHHVELGTAAGLTPEEIRSLATAEPDLPEADRLLVTAADELHATNVISDPTWASLAARYETQQLIELCMLVGQYHLVAFTLNSLGIEREPGFEGVPR
ncbi:MAG: carboxymuconolactone decarboxylase family protein [Acidimicrobiales bacterium]|nr:carboxymuconolactone decarboxylase family protein [Acidimicrobiales bacterium]